MNLAAESHVDRWAWGLHREQRERHECFRFHHVSTDEVFGPMGRFSEPCPYDPRSPYSASKAVSDHLVSAWHHTYGLPVVLTHCSNNYGPWLFPEKLIPLYGDAANVRDWLYVEDHVEVLFWPPPAGALGESYCLGSTGDHSTPAIALTGT